MYPTIQHSLDTACRCMIGRLPVFKHSALHHIGHHGRASVVVGTELLSLCRGSSGLEKLSEGVLLKNSGVMRCPRWLHYFNGCFLGQSTVLMCIATHPLCLCTIGHCHLHNDVAGVALPFRGCALFIGSNHRRQPLHRKKSGIRDVR